MTKKEKFEKYGIDFNKIKNIKSPSLSTEAIEGLNKIAKKYIPVVCNIEFENFIYNVSEGRISEAYSSDVFKTLIQMCKRENMSSLKRNTDVFRARIVDNNDLYSENGGIQFKNGCFNGYNWINSKEPAVGVSSDGRANAKYSSYFYCAEDGNTAASEIKPTINDYISLAKFRTTKTLRLFELSEIQSEINSKEIFYRNRLVQLFSRPVKDTKEYKVTQFISDEIRKCGVDGIAYKSYFTQSYNYVIFNCSMSTLKFQNSRILKLHSQQLNFIDYSYEKTLATKKIDNLTDDEVLKEKINLINMIKLFKDFEKKKKEQKGNGR